MSAFPPPDALTSAELTSTDTPASGVYTLQPEAGRRPWLRFVLAGLVLTSVGLLVLVAVLPGWRNTVSNWTNGRTPQDASTTTTITTNNGDADTGRNLATYAQVANQPTPTPTLLTLALSLEQTTNTPRWQIAYPDSQRGPGLGCAYLAFRLTGADAANLSRLDAIDAELVIYDGEFVFERYGPMPLAQIRGLADPQSYELPGSGPECQRHRFTEPAEYAGLEFRLSLLADGTPVQIYRFGLTADASAFATITPTPLPATITPTPFPQVRVQETINVRGGPGTVYAVLGAAMQNDRYRVMASDATRQWWQIEYQGQIGWVYAPLVEAVAVDEVGVAQNIPATPIPVPTLAPTATPPPPPTPPPAPTPYFPFLLSSVGMCVANPAMTYFEGQVLDRAGKPLTGACVHVAYDGPRNTKCTGCDGSIEGRWGFAPFGNLPGKSGTTVRIYVVPCPESGIPGGGQTPTTGFGPLTPVSPVWTYTVGESVQCTGITFQDNRFFDDDGQQIPPPAPTLAPSANQLYRFQGQGQSFTDPFVLSAGPVRFRISLTGQGTYSLQLLSSIGRNIDILASGTGVADIDKIVTLDTNGTYFVSVITDGPWTILVETP